MSRASTTSVATLIPAPVWAPPCAVYATGTTSSTVAQPDRAIAQAITIHERISIEMPPSNTAIAIALLLHFEDKKFPQFEIFQHIPLRVITRRFVTEFSLRVFI
jgi:hypothetical protein